MIEHLILILFVILVYEFLRKINFFNKFKVIYLNFFKIINIFLDKLKSDEEKQQEILKNSVILLKESLLIITQLVIVLIFFFILITYKILRTGYKF